MTELDFQNLLRLPSPPGDVLGTSISAPGEPSGLSFSCSSTSSICLTEEDLLSGALFLFSFDFFSLFVSLIPLNDQVRLSGVMARPIKVLFLRSPGSISLRFKVPGSKLTIVSAWQFLQTFINLFLWFHRNDLKLFRLKLHLLS